MAGKTFSPDKCNDIANILAIAITAKDDELSRYIAELSEKKNDALKTARALKSEEDVDALSGRTAHELELKAASADIELRAIVQAKLLSGEIKGAEAQMELARQITKGGGTIAGGVELISKLNNSPMADWGDIARLWGGSEENVTRTVTEIKEAIAEFTASNYSIRAYSDFTNDGVAELKKLLKNKEITEEEFAERMGGLHEEVMEKIAKGENPSGFVKLDTEWQTLKKVFKDDMDTAKKAWNQFIMARELLSDGGLDDGVLKAFENLGAENLTGPLTPDWIVKCDSLEELMARAYTNTEQLYRDGALRQAYREKLTVLASGMRLSEDNSKKVKSLIKTMQFAEEGATFSNIVMKNKVYLSAKKIGLDVSKTDGTKLYNGLVSYAKKLAKDENILKEPIEIAGVKMEPIDVIQLCYDITGDKNILKLVETGAWADGIVMSIATQKLLGMDKVATENIIKLFRKSLEAPKVSDIRDVTLKAITGQNVKKGAKVGYFDSRKGLYYIDKLSETRANLMSKIAEKNKMKIDTKGITTINSMATDADTLAETLRENVGGGYLIVNDAKYKENRVLSDAIDKLTGDDKIEVLTPRGGMMANFSMENGNLYYKTISDDLFDDVAGEISIRSLGEAKPTREMLATAYEAAAGKSGDKIRYQASYSKGALDSAGRAISDQQDEYFGLSVVRDENGKLIPAYHGTTSRFNVPDTNKSMLGVYGPGMYFTTSKSTAEMYSEMKNSFWNIFKRRRVLEVYLDIRNPIRQDTVGFKDEWLAALKARGFLVDKNAIDKLNGKVLDIYNLLSLYQEPANRSRFIQAFRDVTGYDGVTVNIYKGDDYWVAFSPDQIKYVDNRVPTHNPNMKYMRDVVVDPDKYDTITKLRNAISPRMTYKGQDAFDYLKNKQHEIYRFLQNAAKYGKGAKGDYAEAINETLKYYEDTRSAFSFKDPLLKVRETLKNIDINELHIDEPIRDPKEIALAIFDYSIWSLDRSQIGKLVSPNGRINKKLFAQLTKDEQIEVANRVLTFGHLYDVREAIETITGGKNIATLGEFSHKLDGAGRRLIDDFGLNPGITTKIEGDMQLSDFIKKFTDNGLLLHEAGIVADENGKVLGVTVGNGVANYTTDLFDVTKGGVGRKYYHNHPSGGMPSDPDITNPKPGIDAVGWILPSGVTVEFSDMAGLKKVWSKYRKKNRLLWKMKGRSRLEEGIAFFYEASRELGVIDKQNWGIYDDIVKAQGGKAITQDFMDKISDRALNELREIEESIVDLLTPEGSNEMRWMRDVDTYAGQETLPIGEAMKVQLFTKDRTWEDIANAYGFPKKIVDGNIIEGVEAWGAWGNGLLYFREMVKEGTCPHELYHAVFEMAGPEKYNKILDDAVALFGYDRDTAEEVLADAFAKWFNTGEFKYGLDAPVNMSKKRQKSFLKRIEDFFKVDVMGWLGLVDNHRAEVEQLFNDIVNCSYLPDANLTFDQSEALIKYNKELNDAAVSYFGEMLGQSSEVVDEEYIKRVQTLLSEKIGMDIQSFSVIKNQSELWQKIDKQFTIDKLTAGKYDKSLVDINAEKVKIEGYSEKELATEIKKDLGDMFLESRLAGNENLELIREAYLDYRTASSVVDSLAAKGRIISLTNGVKPKTLSLNEMKNMFTEGTFKEVYKNLFFEGQEVDDKTMELFIKSINDDLFDGLSIGLAENIVKAGYSLPLLNIKNFVYDYLTSKIDLNSPFIQSFFFKNNIPITTDNVNTIMKTLMPDSFKFDYETSLFKGRMAIDEPSGLSTVFREVDNRFIPDSYSALASITDARAGNLVTNREKEVLEGILDKYTTETLKGMEDGSLKFRNAQELKQEAAYALDMFEQDYLLPRYGLFLAPQEKQALMGMKYSLPIGVAGQKISDVKTELNNVRNRLLGTYSSVLGSAARNNDINMMMLKGYDKNNVDSATKKAIEARRDQLVKAGGVIKEVDGQFIVFNGKDALEQAIKDIPANVQGLESLRKMSRQDIDALSNQQAYKLLRYIEATKGLATNANIAMELMYKQNPQLMQYLFFSTYKVDAKTGLPRIMEGNALVADDFFKNLGNTAIVDGDIKAEVFKNVISEFKDKGFISEKRLSEFIQGAIERQIDEIQSIELTPADRKKAKKIMENIYTNSFIPYTYLRDIPQGKLGVMGDEFLNLKEEVKKVMNQGYTQALQDLESVGITSADNFFTTTTVRLNDGSVVSLKDLMDMDIDSWKKTIFNDENMSVLAADEYRAFEYDDAWPDEKKVEVAKEEKEYRDRIINEYNGNLKALLNQNQIITEAEREAMTAFMRDVRTDLRKYTLPSKMVDALDAVSGLNEEASKGIKNYLIGFGSTVTFGQRRPNQVIERYKLVKKAYRTYYGMTLPQLARMAPTSQAEELALNLAKYFKNLERLTGSADGLAGITTSKDVNKAFYHIGEVFLNLDDSSVRGVKGIFGMLSAIEQNQILKFFKFSKPGQASYYKPFVRDVARDTSNFMEGLGGYRDYVETIIGITRDDFNKLFGSGYDERQFKRIIQGLSGFTLTSDGWGRIGPKILDVLNGSNFIFRFLMSYPGQLFTIPQQGVAYFLKQMGYEKQLGIEDLSEIDEIRRTAGGGILDGAYNELRLSRKTTYNPDDLNPDSFFNRYGIPDIGEAYRGANISTADDYVNMYAKIDKKYSKDGFTFAKLARWFDPYKDNANNFIDGIFARNFKNIAFVKGLKQNDFIQFGTARQFRDFMNDPSVSMEIKSKLLDRVAAYSGRNFRNMLGLGFGGLDRAVGSSAGANIFYGMMQMFNFRGAWGQNIFKQAGAQIYNSLRYFGNGVGLSKIAKNEVARAIATSPEWLNFTQALLNDLKRTRKLQRYQDNGRWIDEEEDGLYGFLDFLDFFRDTMNMTSQWYQGLQSFGPFRPIDEWAGSVLASAMNPTIYKDTYGIGAFFNALHKNFGRQWKPANWIAKAVNAYLSDGASGLWAYFGNEFWNLSFGSLRYMINEDLNGYGYTYEVTGQEGGIPSVIMGESKFGSDKNFMYELDNTETWETLKEARNPENTWSDRKVYHKNLLKGILNASQFFSFFKNIFGNNTSYFTPGDLADVIQRTPAGRELYQRGYVTPRDVEEAEIFFDTLLKHSEYRPGSTTFNKSLINFDETGHMDGKNGHKADADMELWLEHMKYKTNGHGEFVKGNGQKIVDPYWDLLMADVRAHYGNKSYVANAIYNYSKNWLDGHSTDPNYQLYVKMLGQGQAHQLIENEVAKRVEALNAGLSKADQWSKDEYKQEHKRQLYYEIGNSILPGDTMKFFDRLNRLDQDDATVAAIQIIQNESTEEDKRTLEKFYTIEKDDDGVNNVSIKPQYEKVLTQISNMARAVDEGNPERLSAEMSSLAHMFKNSDPTGAITASMIDSVVNRIYDSNRISAKQKEELIVALFHDNEEFIQRNPEKMRELLGDNYDEYADKMNQMLYQWDGKMLSILEDIATSGEKSSGKGLDLSNLFKKISLGYGDKGGSSYGKPGRTSDYGYGDRVPVVIEGSKLVDELGLKGYTPMNAKYIVQPYKSHTRLTIGKDVNRNVNGPKTQTISSKKQLSEIEKKTTKALEAES